VPMRRVRRVEVQVAELSASGSALARIGG
jgi:hypothetical protein